MLPKRLKGVVAAIITPADRTGAPDSGRLIDFALFLLENGCDGLNVLGTTGEATSLSREQRSKVMRDIAHSSLPLERLMVGTGAAAAADAAELTLLAGELGFCGALVLPPFYYKGISDDGLLRYFSIILHGRNVSVPIYLYNFPALSGVQYTPSFVDKALKTFGERIVGLKDSSGDMTYAREIASRPGFDVFPSNEACLTDARAGAFAGCISATANVNSIHCGKAYRDGDTESLARATRIRELFAGKPLVAGVKALASRIRKDGALEEVFPPLWQWSDDEKKQLFRDYDQIAEAEIQRAGS